MADRDDKGHYLPAHREAGPGRDSLYHESMNEQARKLALLGLTDKEMAEFFGVTERTFHNWKDAHPAFFHALNEGKTFADAEVAESLYRRATGEFIEFQKAYKNKETGEIEIVTLKSWNPGDPGAAKLWLTNRKPDKWRDKQSHELTGPDGGPIQTEEVSARELVASRIAGLASRDTKGGDT